MVARQAPGATALMIALAAVLYVVAAATSSEVLIMVAGDDPYTLGGAIGFIGNLVDAGDVLGSVARTSLRLQWSGFR